MIADFNLDGHPDVAVSNTLGGKVAVYLGNGDGTFTAPIPTTSRNALYSAAADLNEDGKPDLVLGGDGLKLFLGNGDGTFQSPETVYSSYGPVKIADLDRDGRLDIALTATNGSEQSDLVVLQGQGDGTFRQTIFFATGSQFPGFFVLRDLNGDKTPEAILSSGTVLLNTSRRR